MMVQSAAGKTATVEIALVAIQQSVKVPETEMDEQELRSPSR
jgi:hypothetical protein